MEPAVKCQKSLVVSTRMLCQGQKLFSNSSRWQSLACRSWQIKSFQMRYGQRKKDRPVQMLLDVYAGSVGALVKHAKFGVLEEQPRHAQPLLLACSPAAHTLSPQCCNSCLLYDQNKQGNMEV